ncbi:MAG: sigma-70 family RNA polymerase sigma factor [Lentisphaeria bacterium]|jgi:RNA polymerase sigma-70 factor (ECF subfamily)|nr:sigma-70 family RNA polymerase sigma factor [Lentisphaeria bacterium]MDY0176851.1 sigma-70 family RNA polymerase sigma factor [Lentisphaeria bacterium]NLZ59174.1 sigma-70 family RNA polymerase sigma factor [Lentisphaerota bacterium]
MRHEQLEQLSDGELVALCRDSGSDQAFNVLYARYRLQLFAYLHRLLPKNRSLVDDFFQQVWIRAVRNWHRYTEQQLLLAWLCTIAHNLVMDHYRSVKNREMLEIHENILSESLSPDEILEQESQQARLKQSIAKLPEAQKEIVQLRAEGLSFKEIAAQKKISINTALGRMHYATANLRKMMQELE